MSRLVGLVRHASHDELGRVLSGRKSDIGLNARGRDEAAELASALAGRAFARIETSPRLRTRQTARILAEALGPEPVIVPALDEIDFGDWAGRGFAELDGDPGWDRWNSARATAPTPGGETMAQAVARAARHIDALAAAGGGPALCVSHCDIIRGAVAHYLELSLNNILRLDAAPANICWLRVDGQGGAQILTLNTRS